MAFSLLLSTSAMAYTEVTQGQLRYELNGTEAYVCGYVGSPTDLVIPATIESDGLTFKVTKISNSAFSGCSNLVTVKAVGNNLVEIGEWAFSGCTSLVSVSFPSVKKIGYRAFYNCTMLSYIVLPTTYTNLGSDAFYGCNRLQAIIYLGNQTSKCGSNADVYNVSNMVEWSSHSFNYTGSAPKPTYVNNLPAGFQPTSYSSLPTLEKNVGTYSTTMPITFQNNDMSFTVDIPYEYTINPAKLTARVKNTSREYGENNPSFQSEYSGFVSGENASVITNSGTYSTSATNKSDVGTYTVTQSGAKAQNYTFEYESGTLTVTKAPLTMTARDKTMTYGEPVPTLDWDFAGLKNSESKPVWTTQPTITTTATSKSNVGTYPITISGGVAKNYDVIFKRGTMTVGKASLTATTKSTTREYGDANPDFELSYSGLKNGETEPVWSVMPTIATPATKTSPVGTYDITATGGTARNYNVQYVNNGKLTVEKAPLTATVRSCTKKQGDNNPTFIIDYEGWKNNETSIVLTEAPVASTTATLNSKPGTYPINVSGGVAMNYYFIYVNGTLTVLPREEAGDPAANALIVGNVTSNKGCQVVLPIALTNEKQITGLQLDLYLPAGVTVATNDKGKMIIATTSRMDGNYSVTGSDMGGYVRIVGYSADSDPFTGTSGDILNVTLNVSDALADGDYSINVKDIVLSDVNNTEYHPNDVQGTLTVKSYTLGDVDNSGAVNINDVVCIINYILKRSNGTFIMEAADVDQNGSININDVVTLINRYILKRNNAPRKAPHLAAMIDDNYLSLATIDIKPGETKEVSLLLNNQNEVKAVQGNVKLPKGLSFATKSNGRLDVSNNNARSEDFTLSCALQDDGSMTFAHYSPDGFAYDGNEGGIFTFKIKADENAAPGNYEIKLSEMVLSIEGVAYEEADRTSILNITSTSGINALDSAENVGTYYTLDGKKLSGKPTRKGVYIKNGKKYVVK